MNDESVDGLMKDKFELGGEAGLAAGPVGRNAGAATDALMHAEILSYSRSRISAHFTAQASSNGSEKNGARNTSSLACSRRGSELDSAPCRNSYTTTEQRTMSLTFVDCQRAIRRDFF
jgi:hypothetical protein